MTMWAGTPRSRAASARAAAWLPEEWVATPRRASSSASDSTALQAPRNLKAPTFWKFSHLKKSRAPAMPSRVPQVSTGVRRAWGRIRSAAARTSANVTGRCSSPVVCWMFGKVVIRRPLAGFGSCQGMLYFKRIGGARKITADPKRGSIQHGSTRIRDHGSTRMQDLHGSKPGHSGRILPGPAWQSDPSVSIRSNPCRSVLHPGELSRGEFNADQRRFVMIPLIDMMIDRRKSQWICVNHKRSA